MKVQPQETRPARGRLPGEWDPPSLEFDPPNTASKPHIVTPGALYIRHVLSARDCQQLLRAMNASGQASPVSVQGRADFPDNRVGSVRATGWSPTLGMQFWHQIKHAVPPSLIAQDTTATDWFAPQAHRHWEPIGVSPLLRFMRYEAGGEHYGHYDAGYDYGDGRRTLMSLVFYLTTPPPQSGGRTRFLQDGQQQKPVWKRNHEDWLRRAEPQEVIAGVSPRAGDALFFHHRLCHDVEPYTGQTPRVIIRADIVYKALDPPQVLPS